MQRPRLTERTAEALEGAVLILRARFSVHSPEATVKEQKRAIEYLEDLLRWHRTQRREK